MKALNILMILLAVFMTACGGGEREKRGTVRVATGDSGIVPGNGGNPNVGPGTTFQALWGLGAGWNQSSVMDLLSASNSQGELQGSIVGLAIAGDIRVAGTNDVRGAVGGTYMINNDSRFRLDICDGVSQTQGCLQLGFSSALNPQARVSGQISNGGQARVIMSDQYGAVVLQGQYNTSEFNGQISYCNGSGCGSGSSFRQLGNFRVPTCGFFHCGN